MTDDYIAGHKAAVDELIDFLDEASDVGAPELRKVFDVICEHMESRTERLTAKRAAEKALADAVRAAGWNG